MQVKKFTFNPFQENTYVLYDDNREAIIVDPGCYDQAERDSLREFIDTEKLKPVRLLNTHAHIDHVFGNQFVADSYELELELHKDDFPILERAGHWAETYGLNYHPSPQVSKELKEGDTIVLGDSALKIIHAPGHAPGHVVFYEAKEKILIGGDVLFRGSIGRTDLPGGNHQQLLDSIREKIFTLDPDTTVYSGHGPETTIGYEKSYNPFF